jgi:hypothetical protein
MPQQMFTAMNTNMNSSKFELSSSFGLGTNSHRVKANAASTNKNSNRDSTTNSSDFVLSFSSTQSAQTRSSVDTESTPGISTSSTSKSLRGNKGVSFALGDGINPGTDEEEEEEAKIGDDRHPTSNPLSDISLNDSFDDKPSAANNSNGAAEAHSKPSGVGRIGYTPSSMSLSYHSQRSSGLPGSDRDTNNTSVNRDTTSTHSDISFSNPMAAQFRRLEVSCRVAQILSQYKCA